MAANSELTAPPPVVAVVGAGPAGLIAAERLALAGVRVTLWERMPSAGRKLLMAGRGGLNLTHGEPLEAFISRYGAAAPRLRPAIEAFPPDALRHWAAELGQETFLGSSGRVIPTAMKASPLLRAWLARLAGLGVELRLRRRWLGWNEQGALRFAAPDGQEEQVKPAAVLLALGGGSWPKLGSDGEWCAVLAARGVALSPLRPANCGFTLDWSPHFRDRFAGVPLKPVALACGDRRLRGEAVVTSYGLEGGALYALSAALRATLEREGTAEIRLDLHPDLPEAALAARLARVGGAPSLATLLRKGGGLSPAAANLLREGLAGPLSRDPQALARRIKDLRLQVTGTQPLERAISSAGGIAWSALDEGYGLCGLPGVFAAGEMLDWEAPTGGYLLQGCFATGIAAANGILAWLADGNPPRGRADRDQMESTGHDLL